MNPQNDPVSFSYRYNAGEQEEIKKIREKYIPKEENKLEQLRRLDKSVTDRASSAALAMGVLGTLVMGIGMSLVMTDIGAALGMTAVLSMAVGIAAGTAGIAAAAMAYPLYSHILKRERERIAPEILRLTDELMK